MNAVNSNQYDQICDDEISPSLTWINFRQLDHNIAAFFSKINSMFLTPWELERFLEVKKGEFCCFFLPIPMRSLLVAEKNSSKVLLDNDCAFDKMFFKFRKQRVYSLKFSICHQKYFHLKFKGLINGSNVQRNGFSSIEK